MYYMYMYMYMHVHVRISIDAGYSHVHIIKEPTANLRKSGALWQLNSALRSLVRSQSLNSGPFLKIGGEQR